MAEPGDNGIETAPEGRGCGFISLIAVLILLVAFAVAAWINAPSASPEPSATGAPQTAPPS
ncbi:MAG TPA: hypothetical protein VN231_07170 [Allosphingosinicella sp.]|nr:hypothetical protein [Allosphingosinicella sp.]